MNPMNGLAEALAQLKQTPQVTGGVNRGGPLVPPTIPIPGNQNMAPGGFMQQAMQLSGVPGGMPTGGAPQITQQQQNPMGILQSLMGTPQGQAQLMNIVQALMGRR